MKMNKKLNAMKTKAEIGCEKLRRLTDDELEQVSGGNGTVSDSDGDMQQEANQTAKRMRIVEVD